MNPAEQIKALAELDGWTELFCEQDRTLWGFRNGRKYSERTPDANYLTSYDAIIPLIQKQDIDVRLAVQISTNADTGCFIDATPTQLCEALLLATGMWKE